MRSASFLSVRTVGSLGLIVLAACATAVKENNANGTAPGDNGPPAETTTVPGGDDGTAPPHALGTITLGEMRVAETGDSSPIISATFLPDAKKGKTCTKKIGACEMAEVPKCTTGTVQGCASGEACVFDDACAAKCVKSCTKSCSSGDECFFTNAAPIEDQGMGCRKRERFDAGAIAFDGTTTSLTLFPPYSIKPDGNGAPFMAKAEIRVQATGASKVGFDKFDEKFTTTTFLQTDPPLADLTRAQVFGTGPLAIGWVPGDDHVVITASGPMGAARCVAEDKAGTFDLQREVITAVAGGATTTTPNITVSVSRERRELKKDKKVIGELSNQSVQPTGWLEFVTKSTESHSFASCQTGYTACGEICTNLQTDPKNCGACGKVCATGLTCSAAICR